jgi:rhodanese-related sulfurtransferase
MEQFFLFLQKTPMNMVLLATAIISGAMLAWPAIARLMRPGQEIGPAEAVQLINRRDAVVLDVRDAAEYKAGHIANARNVPEGELESRSKELDRVKAKPIIVSCGRGNRAATIAARLRKAGFSEVFSLRGGIAAWQQASMPVEKS